MPATAGRVRMPANNRVHSSAALQTHGIWQSAIGYDPYAPANDGSKPGKNPKPDNETENAYASFQGLLTLARITGTTSNETRGACKKCGRVGHLTYQCRNFLTLKDAADTNAGVGGAIQAPGDVIGFVKKEKAKGESEDESDEDEDGESSSSDSDVDPEIERIIAERFGKGMSKKIKKVSSDEESGDDRRRKKKYEHKKRRRSRHHHHHHSHRRRSRIESDSDSSSESSDDGYRKRSDRHRRKRRHKERRSVLSSGSVSTASSSDEDERRKRRERRERKPSRARKSEE